MSRVEIRVPGLAEPISHYTDAVRDASSSTSRGFLRFGAARPASTLVEVSKLAVDGGLIEIEAVALVP